MVNQESLGGSHGSPSLTTVDLMPELLPFNVPKNEKLPPSLGFRGVFKLGARDHFMRLFDATGRHGDATKVCLVLTIS